MQEIEVITKVNNWSPAKLLASLLAVLSVFILAFSILEAASEEENVVTGTVYVPFRGNIDQAVVQAIRRSDGKIITTLTDVSGEYELKLPAGLWSILVMRGTNTVPYSWLTEERPDIVRFLHDGSSENIEINYNLSPSQTEVSGLIRLPDGSAPPFDVRVSVTDDEGYSVSRTAPANSGFFFLAADAGQVTFSAHLPNDQYEPPAPISLNLTNGSQINLGNVLLVEKDAVISASFLDEANNPVEGVTLTAWQTDKSVSTAVSDDLGNVDIAVSGGNWWLKPIVPENVPFTYDGVPIAVTVPSSGSVTIDPIFLQSAPNLLNGQLLDGSNQLVEQDGVMVAYDQLNEPVRSAQFVSGTFSLYLPDGTFSLAPRFAPDSAYTADWITDLEMKNGEIKSVTLAAKHANQNVVITPWDPREEEVVENLEGRVLALNGGGLDITGLQTTGEYALDLSIGDWSFGIDYSNNETHVPLGHASISSVEPGSSATVRIPVAKIDSAITGRVLDPSGNGLPGAVVKAQGIETGFETGFETVVLETVADSTGRYYLQLPHGSYKVWSSDGGPSGGNMVPSTIETVSLRPKAIRPGIDLSYKSVDMTINGVASYPSGGLVESGTVTAYASQGGWITTTIGAGGQFSLPLSSGIEWTVETAIFQDNKRYFASQKIVPNAGQSLSIQLQADPENYSPSLFKVDAAKTEELVVEDQFSILIPANTLPIEGVAYVEVLKDKSAVNSYHNVQFAKSYEIKLFDGYGTPVTKQFLQPIILIHRYNIADLITEELSADQLRPSYYDASTESWVRVDEFVIDAAHTQIVWELEYFREVTLFSEKK
ncbi:MAG: carboxypeptidase-like regulatory domain-containing protein, partial [Chloroflexota bacterium]